MNTVDQKNIKYRINNNTQLCYYTPFRIKLLIQHSTKHMQFIMIKKNTTYQNDSILSKNQNNQIKLNLQSIKNNTYQRNQYTKYYILIYGIISQTKKQL